MKPFGNGLKGLILTCAVIGAAMAVPEHSSAAQDMADVKVQVNEKLVSFPDAQPFIDAEDRMQVPVRFVSERLGYKVEWEMENGQVSVDLQNQDGSQIFLKTGETKAVVDGRPVQLDTTVHFEEGRVYIPLRFITEAAGIHLHWDSKNYIAILNENGRLNAPAWTAPQKTETAAPAKEYIGTFKATAYSSAPEENGGYGPVDYFGNPLRLGTVAVDPNVIPLGTTLYIEGYDFAGLPVGGMTVKAMDTGGAIKGERMDIFIPGSRASVQSFGFQSIKVYKLDKS